jgi:uncharacterized protein (DUF342 family)
VSNGITVTRTTDGLSAAITVLPQRENSYPSCQELLAALGDNAVVCGINNQALVDMVATKALNIKVEVARGVPAEPGIAGRLEMLVDIALIGKPKKLSDDRVDFHDICYVINVHKGDPIARRIPPVLGKEGQTVSGKPIVPPRPSDVKLPIGNGTKLSLSDPDLLVAGNDGGIGVEADGSLEVRKEEKIIGDIDYQTGDVTFAGDLTITGSLRAGFSVENKGTLIIGGSVEDSTIKCQGTIVIKRGAVGSGSGTIECKGAVRARHLENFRVIAGGDVVITENMVNAVVESAGFVYAKSIRGGCVASLLGVEAGEIGSISEVKTVVDIGKKYERIQLRYKLLSKLALLTTEIEKNRELVFQLVRDNLDENGALSMENEQMLDALKVKSVEIDGVQSSTQVEIESLDGLKYEGDDPYVKANVIYPNTIVKFGTGEQLIRERLEQVRLTPVEKGATIALVRENVD